MGAGFLVNFVDGGEPKSCHSGRFVASSYRIMAENPAMSAEIGHGGLIKNHHQYPPRCCHGRYLTALFLVS
jgi:hypothetical protein